MRKTHSIYYNKKLRILLVVFMLSILSLNLFANSGKAMYFSAAVGGYQDLGQGDFQSAYKNSLKTISDNIDFTNRAFFEESNAGVLFDFSFGGVLIEADSYYLEGAISYVLSQGKEATSIVTDSGAQQTQVVLKHQFKERLLFMRVRYFYKFLEQFHLGAGFGLANGYSLLSTTTDVSFFGSNPITNNYKGSGFAYELSGHIKYIPKFTQRLSLVMNLGLSGTRVGELVNKQNDEPFQDQFSNPIKFNHLTLFTTLEVRFQF